jgi:lysyl-tRNA synthetase class 2
MTVKDEFHIRMDKVEAIRSSGELPYPSISHRTALISEALEHFGAWSTEQKTVILSGRIMTTRIHGKMAFADLEDASGLIQIQLTEDRSGIESFSHFLDQVDPADFLEVKGVLFLTKRGQQSVAVTEWKILAKALRPLPEKWHGLKDVEIRYREREMDLVSNAEVRQVFRTRSKIIRAFRRRLDLAGFDEVETPILQPIAGGATARPFMTHHNALNHDFYLRIAPELYLKRCVVGGYEKVYELGRQFRNEGVDWSHNPEFTSLEFYWAYQNYEGLMVFTEELISGVVQDVLGTLKISFDEKEIDFTPPWPRKRFRDAIKESCGIDIEGMSRESLMSVMREKKMDVDSKADLGTMYDDLYKETVRKYQIQPMFIIDHPIEMEPLAKKCEYDSRYVQRFQLLAGGLEMLKAYTELNDPIDQRERFELQDQLREEGNEEAQTIDEAFLRAMEHGLPPTAGWGMGIDRFVMMFTNQKSLKDVILFPTLKPSVENRFEDVSIAEDEKG